MARIAFLGLGNMGLPMALNLKAAGHEVAAFDVAASALARAAETGLATASGAGAAIGGAAAVITMLPAGAHVREAYLGPEGIVATAGADALLVDCSTIDVASARLVAEAAGKAGMAMIDAPVSGGVAGAEAASLTFMVGGPEGAVERARPLLGVMGARIVHAGGPGAGQAAKICNNLILGVSMIAVCEAFALGDALGLDRHKLFDVASVSSGQCWSLTTYCPVPGPVPASPANREYRPGFSAAMMLKDLRLAAEAAGAGDAPTPLAAQATALYERFCAAGGADRDFSAIFELIAAAGERDSFN